MRAAELYPRFARVRFITIMNGDLRIQKCRQLLLRTFSNPAKKTILPIVRETESVGELDC